MHRLIRLLGRRVGSVPVAVIAAVSTVVVLASATAVVITTSAANESRPATLGTPPPQTPARPPRSATPGPAETTPEPASAEDQASVAPGEAPIALTNHTPGTGEWQFAGPGPILGSGGPTLTYRVAVEVGVPVSLDAFTAMVDSTLGDPRGWAGQGARRFQRVGQSSAAYFTVYLASPWTAYSLCRSVVDIRIGGVPYTNCQAGAPVVINSDRYLSGASRFTGDLDTYRRYAINHEVGHRLGRQHENCPGAGALAPVMQQQTLGMQGCRPNAWPDPQNPAPPPPPSESPTTPANEPEPDPTDPTAEPTEPTDPATTSTQTTTIDPASG